MTEASAHEDKLFEQAFDLLIRLRNDPANEITLDLIEQWRNRSSDHESVWEEALNIHSIANTAVRKNKKTSQPLATLSRRSVILGAAATAVFVPTGLMLASSVRLRLSADHLTTKAEVLTVPLADGSIVTLGPESAIATNFSDEGRHVELLAGMAFFDVRRDRQRSFNVIAGDIVVQTSMATFDLYCNETTTTVTLDTGTINASSRIGDVKNLWHQGDVVIFDNASGNAEIGNQKSDQIAAWRDRRLIAQNDPIASVVEQIAPWQSGKVLLADRTLGQQRISGVYNLNKPISALQAAVGPYGGKVREITPWLTIISRA